MYQQKQHFITRFKDGKGKYYQQDGFNKSTSGYAFPVRDDFPFFTVDNRKTCIPYLVFYVLQEEQEEQEARNDQKRTVKRKYDPDMI